jgi:hypothetical protein
VTMHDELFEWLRAAQEFLPDPKQVAFGLIGEPHTGSNSRVAKIIIATFVRQARCPQEIEMSFREFGCEGIARLLVSRLVHDRRNIDAM